MTLLFYFIIIFLMIADVLDVTNLLMAKNGLIS